MTGRGVHSDRVLMRCFCRSPELLVHYAQVVSHEGDVGSDLDGLLERIVDAFDEPFADPAALPTWVLSELTRRHVKVAISGDGGDELFAGYWRHRRDRLERRLRALLGRGGIRALLALSERIAPASVRDGLRRLGMPPDLAYAWKHCGLYFSKGDKASLYTDELARACRGYDPADRLRERYRHCEASDPLDKALYVDLTTCLPDDLLVKLDRTSMAHGLEVRVPFLDHRVVEQALRLPSFLKLSGGRSKVALHDVFDRQLPRVVRRRRKAGFDAPLSGWLRGSLRELVRDTLAAAPLERDALLDAKEVNSLVDSHERRSGDHGWPN